MARNEVTKPMPPLPAEDGSIPRQPEMDEAARADAAERAAAEATEEAARKATTKRADFARFVSSHAHCLVVHGPQGIRAKFERYDVGIVGDTGHRLFAGQLETSDPKVIALLRAEIKRAREDPSATISSDPFVGVREVQEWPRV